LTDVTLGDRSRPCLLLQRAALLVAAPMESGRDKDRLQMVALGLMETVTDTVHKIEDLPV
jgi:hypothetical protein